MGGALHDAWVAQGHAVHSVSPETPGAYASLDALPTNVEPQVVVFAVKPQVIPEVLPLYAARFGTSPLYISVAAGVPQAVYARHLGEQARVVRAMPNTPVIVGQGMTALHAGKQTKAEDMDIALTLFASTGLALYVENEDDMHAVTALSGSGPAFVFHFMEALIEAGKALGLDEATARMLAQQTVLGSAALAIHSSEPLATLRQNVTSPGGTTQAGLEVLMRDGALSKLLTQTLQAAAQRSKELAG